MTALTREEQEKLEKARALAVKREPFGATVMLFMRYELAPMSGARAYTSPGGTVTIDRDFFAEAPVELVAETIVHERWHVQSNHFGRAAAINASGDRLANLAMDAVINWRMRQDGWPREDGCVMPKDLGLEDSVGTWPWERVYVELRRQEEKRREEQEQEQEPEQGDDGDQGEDGGDDGGEGEGDELDSPEGAGDGQSDDQGDDGGEGDDGQGGDGDGVGDEGDGTPDEAAGAESSSHGAEDSTSGTCGGGCCGMEAPEGAVIDDDDAERAERADVVRHQAAEHVLDCAMKNPGSVPGHVMAWADNELAVQEVNWRHKLRHVAMRGLKSRPGATRSTFMARSPLQNAMSAVMGRRAPVLPSTHAPEPDVLVAADVSYSMSEEERERTLVEVEAVIKAIRCDVTFAVFTTDVNDCKRVGTAAEALAMMQLGGGTAFQPVFDLAEKLRPDMLIIVTDGEAVLPERKPRGVKVIWVLTQPASIPPHLGESILVNS